MGLILVLNNMNPQSFNREMPTKFLRILFFILVVVQSSSFTQGLKGIELPGLKTITASKKLLNFNQANPINIETFLSHSSVQQNETFGLLVRFNMAEEWHIYGKEEQIGTPTAIRLLSDEFIISNQQLSPSKSHISGEGDSKIISHWLENQSYLLAFIKLKDNLILPPNLNLKLEVVYQPCTETSCLMVKTQEINLPIQFGQTKRVTLEKWMEKIPDFSNLIQPVETSPSKNLINTYDLLNKGILAALLSAFLWGLLASLTPCVYPMIPITVSLFSDQENQKYTNRILSASIYILGIALSYASLGMIASYSGRDLGSWLANPYVATLLALIMVLMALSMFGLFDLDLPNGLKEKLVKIEGTRPLTLFLMGAVMGFVAAPCVGPFFGAIMIWLVKNPGEPIFGFLMMLSFGLGLGTLFLLVALFSQSILPKSGNWMVIIKKIMGYILLGMALYFLEVLLDLRHVKLAWGIYLIVGGSLAGAFVSLSWEDPWWKKVSRGLGVLIFLLGLIMIFQSSNFTVPSSGAKSLQPPKTIFNNHKMALEEGLRLGKPVFLYFGAQWCIPCKKIKEVVLKDRRIEEELERFVVAMLDCTKADSHGAMVKKDVYNSPSMPFFAFHSSQGDHLADLDVHKALDTQELLNILSQVR